MSALVWAGVGLAGAVGAAGRFTVDGVVSRRLGHAFPYGTLVVNLTGAFVLGLVVGGALSGDALRLVGTGLLGAYTTFSTWMFESHHLAGERRSRAAVANVVVTIVVGVVAAALGRRLGTSLFG